MIEVGRIDVDPSDAEHSTLNSLQWMPDGKGISYIYKSTLYAIHVKDQL